MAYLLDKKKFNYNPQLYQLYKINNDIDKEIYKYNLQKRNNPNQSTSFMINKLKVYESDLQKIQSLNKGFHAYAGLFGLAIYHTFRIVSTKTLFNEMGKGAFTHAGICLTVGMASGLLYGQVFGKDRKVQKKLNDVKPRLKSILEIKK
jgi:hypothetical protein